MEPKVVLAHSSFLILQQMNLELHTSSKSQDDFKLEFCCDDSIWGVLDWLKMIFKGGLLFLRMYYEDGYEHHNMLLHFVQLVLFNMQYQTSFLAFLLCCYAPWLLLPLKSWIAPSTMVCCCRIIEDPKTRKPGTIYS